MRPSPETPRRSCGARVILSIMDQEGDLGLIGQVVDEVLTDEAFSSHALATVITLACSFSPLWEQLSMLTTARG